MKINKFLISVLVLIIIASALFVVAPFFSGFKFLRVPITAAQIANCPATDTAVLSGFAWSSNIGWISFGGNAIDGSPYGVYMNPAGGALCGYAWSPNIGWVSFNIPSSCPAITFKESPKVPAYFDATSNTIQGWAETVTGMGGKTCGGPSAGEWDGWIKMSSDATASAYGVKLVNNNLSGYAWGGDIIGWIDFSGVSVSGGQSCTPGTVCPNGQVCNADGVCPSPGCSGNPSQCFPGICNANGSCGYSCSLGSDCLSGVCIDGVCSNSCTDNPSQCFPGSCGTDGKCLNTCSSKLDCLSGQCVNGQCVVPSGDPGSGPINIPDEIAKIVNNADEGTSIVDNGTNNLINTILNTVNIPVQSSACKELNLKISWNPAPALNKEVTFMGSSDKADSIFKWVWIFKSDIIIPGIIDSSAHTAIVKFIKANWPGFGNKSAVVLGVKLRDSGEVCYVSKTLFVGGRTEE